MIDYKGANYYTSFFENHPGFKVIKSFDESKEEDDKNLYIGYVEVLNTIYPLVLRVEIPFSFPHKKLIFRTKSISGYPHLIHNGKIKHGDWFCLNTPFAETAEEQLNQEVYRLKEWISHQMRNDLPPIIKDANVQKALLMANAYDWENLDEINELRFNAILTFVGNFNDELDSLGKKGHLNCVKTPDNRFYALKNEEVATHKLPYILLDEWPKPIDALNDLVRLSEMYDWDEEILNHLLPEINISTEWKESNIELSGNEDITEEEALEKLKEVEIELKKDESYLPRVKTIESRSSRNNSSTYIKVLDSQKPILLQEIENIKAKLAKDHNLKINCGSYTLKSWGEMTEVEREERMRFQEEMDYCRSFYPYIFHYFALGVKNQSSIDWIVFYTSREDAIYKNVEFYLGVKPFRLSKLSSYPLFKQKAENISENQFFGRGAFSTNITNKRIAIIGLGAIGSMVADAFAHSGVSKIGLWDTDIVEPGNICRSKYDLGDLGESKVIATAQRIARINPYIKIKDIKKSGHWFTHGDPNIITYENGSFYANVNYMNQADAAEEIQGYDLIFDCTGSNEILHFLSYSIPTAKIISMCITNHAANLLCLSNCDGNPFELRKTYLSKIEQDTKNYFLEGSGCYSPTFLASNCDIATLVNLALRNINIMMKESKNPSSIIYSYTDRGVIADSILTFKLVGYDIILNIPNEVWLDAKEMDDCEEDCIGYVFGSYSKDGKQIMMTNIIESIRAKKELQKMFEQSHGIIDYIGDYSYSGLEKGSYRQSSANIISAKALDDSINTNNPLLITRNTDDSLNLFLYINNELVPFELVH